MQKFTISGKVPVRKLKRKALRKRTVSLVDAWGYETSKATTKRGRFSFKVSAPSDFGSAAYKVLVPGVAKARIGGRTFRKLPAFKRTLRVAVTGVTTVTATWPKSKMLLGSDTDYTVTVQVDGTDPVGRTVRVESQTDDGTWTELDSWTTNQKGAAALTLDTDWYYRDMPHRIVVEGEDPKYLPDVASPTASLSTLPTYGENGDVNGYAYPTAGRTRLDSCHSVTYGMIDATITQAHRQVVYDAIDEFSELTGIDFTETSVTGHSVVFGGPTGADYFPTVPQSVNFVIMVDDRLGSGGFASPVTTLPGTDVRGPVRVVKRANILLGGERQNLRMQMLRALAQASGLAPVSAATYPETMMYTSDGPSSYWDETPMVGKVGPSAGDLTGMLRTGRQAGCISY